MKRLMTPKIRHVDYRLTSPEKVVFTTRQILIIMRNSQSKRKKQWWDQNCSKLDFSFGLLHHNKWNAIKIIHTYFNYSAYVLWNIFVLFIIYSEGARKHFPFGQLQYIKWNAIIIIYIFNYYSCFITRT